MPCAFSELSSSSSTSDAVVVHIGPDRFRRRSRSRRAADRSWQAAAPHHGTSRRWQRTAGRRTGPDWHCWPSCAASAHSLLRTPSGDRGTAQRRRRPAPRSTPTLAPVGLVRRTADTPTATSAPDPRTDHQPHDTTGSTRPHRGRRPRRTDRHAGWRLVRRTWPVRRGGQVRTGHAPPPHTGARYCLTTPTPGSTFSRRSGTPTPPRAVRPRASTLAMASTCAAPAAGSMPARTCAPRSKCSKTLRPRGGAAGAEQELRASGETARRRDVTTATQLTAQGTANRRASRPRPVQPRDAAAQLFLSPAPSIYTCATCSASSA